MASSNRHWPSMFKSKPHPHQHQWQQQPDMNSSIISSNGCHQRSPYSASSGAGCEERSPEPKPRWNPRPEQIRILEAIFNSGMVNPPRDEIRKIRAQLQEYGQVGDANVFYWFQNRKSRSKHKQRHLQNKLQSSGSQTTHDPTPPLPAVTSIAVPNSTTTPSSSSSSSSDKSTTNYSPNSTDKILSLGAGASSSKINMLLDSPTASVNQQQPFLHTDFLSMSPFFFPVQQAAGVGTQGFMSFTDQPPPPPPEPNVVVSSVDDGADNNNSVVVESCSGLLLSDLLLLNHGSSRRTVEDHDEKMKLQQLLGYTSTTAPTTITSIPTLQGVGESGGVGPTKSTVFINDVAFEVTMMAPFNVREAFGEDAVLVHSSGQPVLTNEWGITLQPLHHGSFYYLIRTLPSSTSAHHHA